MQVLLTNKKGSFDITPLIPTVKWSGDYMQAARTLDFSIVSSPTDPTIPVVEIDNGCHVTFKEGETLFSGHIFTRTKTTGSSTIALTCYDKGYYLKKNKTIKKYTGRQPEDITRDLAAEFGFEVGELASTGIQVSRNFITPTSIYDIISTAYTLASQSNGKKYHIGFRGNKLYVTEKVPNDRTLIIQGKSNLIEASVTESVADMVNAVAIYDANGNYVRSVENGEWIKLYGRMQDAVKQTNDDDKAAEAERLLSEGGPTQKITIDNLGNIANITGGTVVVREPYTGLYGLFYIDSDIHEWKRGQYYNKLTLNFKALMNEKEAGSLPNADGSKTGGSTDESGSDKLSYINKPGSGGVVVSTNNSSGSGGDSEYDYTNKPS